MGSPFIDGLSLLIAVLIVKEDWRDKKIPLSLLIGFAGLSFLHFWENFSFLPLSMSVVIGIILLYLEKKELIGMADCLLIPSCLLWIALEKIPLFLIAVGSIGILIAFYWRQTHGEKTYPFAPAILIAWLLSVTL